jgi:hypothetical protein
MRCNGNQWRSASTKEEAPRAFLTNCLQEQEKYLPGLPREKYLPDLPTPAVARAVPEKVNEGQQCPHSASSACGGNLPIYFPLPRLNAAG